MCVFERLTLLVIVIFVEEDDDLFEFFVIMVFGFKKKVIEGNSNNFIEILRK